MRVTTIVWRLERTTHFDISTIFQLCMMVSRFKAVKKANFSQQHASALKFCKIELLLANNTFILCWVIGHFLWSRREEWDGAILFCHFCISKKVNLITKTCRPQTWKIFFECQILVVSLSVTGVIKSILLQLHFSPHSWTTTINQNST